MQVSRSPMARWMSSAATELSTPPERAQITLPFGPTRSRIAPIASSAKPFIVQLPESLQSPKRKARSISLPRGVCTTSGWNCTPADRPATGGRVGLDRGEGRAAGGRDPPHARREREDAVAMAHPHDVLDVAREALEERIVAFELERRATVFPVVGRLDAAAEQQRRSAAPRSRCRGSGRRGRRARSTCAARPRRTTTTARPRG